jgi:hypothetical protein
LITPEKLNFAFSLDNLKEDCDSDGEKDKEQLELDLPTGTELLVISVKNVISKYQ